MLLGPRKSKNDAVCCCAIRLAKTFGGARRPAATTPKSLLHALMELRVQQEVRRAHGSSGRFAWSWLGWQESLGNRCRQARDSRSIRTSLRCVFSGRGGVVLLFSRSMNYRAGGGVIRSRAWRWEVNNVHESHDCLLTHVPESVSGAGSATGETILNAVMMLSMRSAGIASCNILA